MSTLKSVCHNCLRELIGYVRQCPHCCSDDLTTETTGAIERPSGILGCVCGQCAEYYSHDDYGESTMTVIHCSGPANLARNRKAMQ